MTISNRQESLLLLLGDIGAFYFALFSALYVRYGEISEVIIDLHFIPFSILFLLWIFIFYIAGLYEKHTLILRNRLPAILFGAQLTNALLAVLFFYLIPFFGIAPKTTLFICIVFSSILIFLWRFYGFSIVAPGRKEKALLIGTGVEMRELLDEVNNNLRYRLYFVSTIDLEKMEGIDIKKEVIERIYVEGISVIVADFNDGRIEPVLPHLYNLVFSRTRFIDMHKVYEDTFDRVPLSFLKYSWFLENISVSNSPFYDLMKRIIDIIFSIFASVVLLVLYPFVFIAMKIEGRGPVIITQERMGLNNHPIKVYKFRTMERYEDGVWLGETQNKVTTVGRFLRRTSIDELPQIWNVFIGNLSFIGPRSDVLGLEKRLRESIPYYNVRYLIKPGISGWAQVKQSYAPGNISPQSLEESKIRLAYDLYYIKNRSLILDLKIMLHTARALIGRVIS